MSDCNRPTTRSLPAFSLSRAVLFPGMRCAVLLATGRACAALHASMAREQQRTVAVFAARTPGTNDPEPANLYRVGTAARVLSLSHRPCCGRWLAELEGVTRVRSVEYIRLEPFREVLSEPISDPPEALPVLDALASQLRTTVLRTNALFPRCAHATQAVARVRDVRRLEDLPGAVYDLLLHLGVADRQRLLETEPLSARLEATYREIHARLTRHDCFSDSGHRDVSPAN